MIAVLSAIIVKRHPSHFERSRVLGEVAIAFLVAISEVILERSPHRIRVTLSDRGFG